ncbi:MAG: zinc dependent phospholipase C family protein [Nitrospira sp.]|nr:zinc dependent phospholipase C family protein [bacterium]MBL7048960.1 zinc dependent phospholipase C family protein [Nitrospira sp.]
MFVISLILSFLLIPAVADAWGPLTHVYLGYQILDLGASLIPLGIYSIINNYRNDFLYGNLSADIILGRRFQGLEKSSHNWEVAWRILESSESERQKAFAYGYLMHLCADTVIHNHDNLKLSFSHSILELRSDSILDKKYRRIMKNLDKYMQKKNDIFLEKTLESLIFSFKTNKRIFKGLLVLSRLPSYTPVSSFIDKRFTEQISPADIREIHKLSLIRMFELLNCGRDSAALKHNPLGKYQKKAS